MNICPDTRALKSTLGIVVFALFSACAMPAFAQVDLSDLSVAAPPDINEDELVQTSAYFTAPNNGDPAKLYVTAEIAPGWHIYSITQPKGTPGPTRSEVKVNESKEYRLAGEFVAENIPTVHEYKEVWPNLKVEEHEGKVTWVAPIEIAPGTDLSKLEINGSLYAQACSQACIPPTDFKFLAKLNKTPPTKQATSVNSSVPPKDYKQSGSYLTLSGVLDSSTVKPGTSTTIRVTATPDSHWHLYALADKDPKVISKPTLIVFDSVPGLSFGSPKSSSPPIVKPSEAMPGTVESYYEKPVTWEIPVTVAADAPNENHIVKGWIGFQTCTDKNCDLPRAVQFSVNLKVAKDAAGANAESIAFSDAKYSEVSKKADKRAAGGVAKPDIGEQPKTNSTASTQNAAPVGFDESALQKNVQMNISFWEIMFGAFFGGMLLNLMPCVFPVIGLKILSFVEQSHHNRAKLFSLNLWYTVGVLAVFLGIATVAVLLRIWIGADFKYGSQNSIPAVAIGMAALFFVMALSLLGVWDIPIPGFLGSGKAAELTSHEGASGAIAKGVITTLLGASCSGPLVAAPFGFALDKSTPILAVYGTFFLIGLGMAFPYLILGMNPSLLRFLPKPGAWMDTFKHVCGFVLLGAMVWVLTWLKFYYIAPTVAFLIGLWAACWWIGHVPLTVSTSKRLQAWGWSLAIAAIVGLVSFDWLLPRMEKKFSREVDSEIARLTQEMGQVASIRTAKTGDTEDSELPWKPFSQDLLVKLTRERKTVMVDFTADWCPNCQVLAATVLNTSDVKRVVVKNDVVPLIADYTDKSPELTKLLSLLKAGAIPVLAIFPADNPNDPIVFRGGYTQQILIDALNKAGPSKSASETRTASTK